MLLLSYTTLAQADACAEACADLGYCVEIEGVCQASSDAHCQAARVCREHEHCFFIDAQPYAPGRCGPQDERDALEASKQREADSQAAGLLGLLAGSAAPSASTGIQQGWRDEPALMRLEPPAGTSHIDPHRPHRVLDPAQLICPMATQRETEREPGEYTRTSCVLPNGRKKGPELVVRLGSGRRMYTEYELDQEHGEHLITEADGRVMVRGHYELGLKAGLWESWYVGGGRASSGSYLAGDKIGIWKEWSLEGVERRCDYRDPAVPDSQCVNTQD